jgi:hypothetical protein
MCLRIANSHHLEYNNASVFPFLARRRFMKRQLLWVVVPSLLIGSCILVAVAAEPSANNVAPNEFAGKIVCVQMTNEKVVLENVKIIVHGTESFLAGTGIKRNDLSNRHAWWEGLPIRVNLRFVVAYFLVTPEQWANVRGNFDIPAPASQ